MPTKKDVLTPEIIEAEAIEAGGGLIERVESEPAFPALWLGLSAASFALAGVAWFATKRRTPAIAAGAVGAVFLAIGASEALMSNIEESEAQRLAYH